MGTGWHTGLGPLDLARPHPGHSWDEMCPMISLEMEFQLLVTILYAHTRP